MSQSKKRIVVTTFGSLGDLYPYIAIALELQARGHEVIMAAAECYRERIKALGLPYHSVRPNCEFVTDPILMHRLMHPTWGLLRVIGDLLMPSLRGAYEDTLNAVEGADLLVAFTATYASRLVTEKTGIPWVSALHIPLGISSAYDPPILPGAAGLSQALRILGPPFWIPLRELLKRLTGVWAKPWHRLRAEIGLPPVSHENPLVDGHSPLLNLALFSELLAPKQADWPPQTLVTGFPWFDGDNHHSLPPALERFLESSSPPLVFTLGSAVATAPGSFYEVSAKAARRLGHRAVLVLKDHQTHLPFLPPDIIAVDYAPFAQLFPRALAIVHHGGIGTTGLGMRSGRPMLIVPWAWDQPDNAARAARLGVARVLSPDHYSPSRVKAELRHLLDHPRYSRNAERVAERIRKEDGVRSACNAIEALLAPNH